MRQHTDAERALLHGLKCAMYLAQMEQHEYAAAVAETVLAAFETETGS